MSYQIIIGTSKSELESAIAAFITANPTYSTVGGVAVNNSTWAQVVAIAPAQSGGGSGGGLSTNDGTFATPAKQDAENAKLDAILLAITSISAPSKDLTIQAISNLPCNINQNSFAVTGAIPIPYKSICVQVDISGADANTGVLKLQYSLTGAQGSFQDVPGAVISPSSGSTSNYINVPDFCGKFLTIDWNKGSNTVGTMNAVIYCK